MDKYAMAANAFESGFLRSDPRGYLPRRFQAVLHGSGPDAFTPKMSNGPLSDAAIDIEGIVRGEY